MKLADVVVTARDLLNGSPFSVACFVALACFICASIPNALVGDTYVLSDSEVFLKDVTNASHHVYPYLASVISVICLLAVIMTIICYGGSV